MTKFISKYYKLSLFLFFNKWLPLDFIKKCKRDLDKIWYLHELPWIDSFIGGISAHFLTTLFYKRIDKDDLSKLPNILININMFIYINYMKMSNSQVY